MSDLKVRLFVMPNYVNVHPHAKINLHLEVGKKRDDGFHEIRSLMQEISICDDMVVKLSPSKECNLKILGADIGRDNSLSKAYCAFKSATGIDFGVDVSLLKKIPIGAGLGGASSDAVSLILAMDGLLETKLDYETLLSIALEVGSDVPFFLTGGGARVEGRGDVVTPCSFDCCYVGILVYPNFASYTREAYEMLDARGVIKSEKMVDLKDVSVFNSTAFNSFETPLFLRYPELQEIKKVFLTFAADASFMTGAGSSVYGLFRSWEGASVAWDYVSRKWGKCSFFIPIEK